MYFFPEHLLLKQSLSFVKLLVRSRLSSHKHTLPLEPAHARAANVRLGDHLPTTSKQKRRSYKNHPNSCICMAGDTFDAMYQTTLSHAPVWLTLNNHFAPEQTLPVMKDRNAPSSVGKHILQNNSFFSDVSVLMT